MVQRIILGVLLLLSTPTGATQPTSRGAKQPTKQTRVEWVRRGPTGPVKVIGTKTGGRHAEANRDLQKVADILEGIRTTERFVLWQRIAWTDGRLAIEAVAKTASMANVATIALRRFFPNYGSAGTGIKPLRGYPGYAWRIVAQLNPKMESKRP